MERLRRRNLSGDLGDLKKIGTLAQRQLSTKHVGLARTSPAKSLGLASVPSGCPSTFSPIFLHLTVEEPRFRQQNEKGLFFRLFYRTHSWRWAASYVPRAIPTVGAAWTSAPSLVTAGTTPKYQGLFFAMPRTVYVFIDGTRAGRAIALCDRARSWRAVQRRARSTTLRRHARALAPRQC